MTGSPHGLTRLDQLMKTCIYGNGPARPSPQTLGRVMPPNPVQIKNITHRDVIAAVDSHPKCKFCIKTERCTEAYEWDAATLT